jgi:hypothetical protein
MASEFTAYYDLAQSFYALIGSGDKMTGTVLRHQGHVVAYVLDERNVRVTTERNLPVPTDQLRGIVTHVLKRHGVVVINSDLSTMH